VTDGTRYRYCFNGITEEVVKESVDGAHSDTAFEYVEEEDGNSASEWYVYDNDPAGATVSSVADYDRLSYVIKCDGQSGNAFAMGDNDAEDYNPNDSAWNETRRVISFWYKGGFSPMYVGVTTSSGSKLLLYYCGNGTNYEDGSGNVCFYLGSGASSSVWNRFERNIEEDWESVSAATWSNTDGLLIQPDSAASYDFYIDHLRFSNSRTKVHNTLSGSSVGQIVSAKNHMSDSYGQPEDVWYSYDHIGNVVNLSSSTGAKTVEYAQDAFGNVLSSATTGAWATSADGRHLTTKEYEDEMNLYNFGLRWYDPEIGRFDSKDPMFSFANKDLLFKVLLQKSCRNQVKII
jgi:RHS repeat-associated protein